MLDHGNRCLKYPGVKSSGRFLVCRECYFTPEYDFVGCDYCGGVVIRGRGYGGDSHYGGDRYRSESNREWVRVGRSLVSYLVFRVLVYGIEWSESV